MPINSNDYRAPIKKSSWAALFLALTIAALTCLFTGQSFAQMPVPFNAGLSTHHNPDGSITIEFHAFREDGHWLPRSGAQFSAIYETTSTHTLPNGAHVTQSGSYERLYRDSEGRARREMLLRLAGDETNGIFIIEVFDPIAGVQFVLDDQSHIAHRAPFSAEKPRPPSLTVPGYTAETDPAARRPNPNESTEYFVNQTMEGVNVVGKRITRNYAAGFQGSGVPFTIVNEEWLCPELDMRILDKSTDSRGTERTFRVSNINRSEPDASLFRIPEGYTTVDEAGGFVMTLKRKQ
jgi:hypothetical protein